MHNKIKKGTYGCPYVPRLFAESASELLLRLVLGLVEFVGQRVQVAGHRELPVGDGTLDLGGLAQLDVEELFEKTDAAMYCSKQSGKSTFTFS